MLIHMHAKTRAPLRAAAVGLQGAEGIRGQQGRQGGIAASGHGLVQWLLLRATSPPIIHMPEQLKRANTRAPHLLQASGHGLVQWLLQRRGAWGLHQLAQHGSSMCKPGTRDRLRSPTTLNRTPPLPGHS